MAGFTTAMALGIGAAASGAGQIYATKASARENRRVTEAQRASEQQQMEMERRRYEQEQAWMRHQQMQAQQAERARWEQYQRLHQPMWDLGQNALRTAAGQLGVQLPQGGAGGPVPGGAPASPQNIGQMIALARASGGPPSMGAPGAYAPPMGPPPMAPGPGRGGPPTGTMPSPRSTGYGMGGWYQSAVPRGVSPGGYRRAPMPNAPGGGTMQDMMALAQIQR